MTPSRKSKAVGLFSGGLDSILAARLIAEQGISTVLLHFRLPFAVPGRAATEERLQRLADAIGAGLVSVDAGDDYWDMVREPEFGYSHQLAPCVDCLVYMLRKAGLLMREIKADFVFSGEVVGQRAFSQSKRSLRVVEKAAGLEGRLLRPLSAKLLEPTIPELAGIVRRERLLDFHGHSRRHQIRLARDFGVVDYPVPGAGCLLADRNFAARCRDAVAHGQFEPGELELLKRGRHFRLESGARVVVGRNEAENRQLEQLLREGDVLCRPAEVTGPVALIRSQKVTKKDTEICARICARYCDAGGGKPVRFVCAGRELSVKALTDDDLAQWRIQASEPERATACPKEVADPEGENCG